MRNKIESLLSGMKDNVYKFGRINRRITNFFIEGEKVTLKLTEPEGFKTETVTKDLHVSTITYLSELELVEKKVEVKKAIPVPAKINSPAIPKSIIPPVFDSNFKRTSWIGVAHKESEIKIYKSKDYDRFVKMRGNRALNKSKIWKINNDIRKGLNITPYAPAIVMEDANGFLEIFDGQHRVDTSIQRKDWIYYVIAKEQFTIQDVTKVNSNMETWKTKDYMHSYVDLQNEHYVILNDFIKKYKFPLVVGLTLLSDGIILKDAGNNLKNEYKQGAFEVKKYDDAVRVADIISDFKTPYKYTRTFIVAVCKVISKGKVDIGELIAKVNKHDAKLLRQAGFKEYIANLEMIMNLGKSERILIY